MLKALAKNLPHPLLLRLYHRYELHRQSTLARIVSDRVGLPLLETLDLSQVKTSDTVFVLGSGWSINDISDRRWEIIARHDTIALNFWPLHSLVPRIYLFENVNREEGYELMFDTLQQLLCQQAGNYQNVIKIISELRPLGPRQLVLEIPESFRPNLYLGRSTAIVARSEQEFIAGMRYLRRTGIFDPGNHIAWHFKYGSSVIAALSLAVRMHYRRIVLCGIDLGNADYFYHDATRYPEASAWEFMSRTEPQVTAVRLAWRLSAQDVIHHFKQEVLDPTDESVLFQHPMKLGHDRIFASIGD